MSFCVMMCVIVEVANRKNILRTILFSSFFDCKELIIYIYIIESLITT